MTPNDMPARRAVVKAVRKPRGIRNTQMADQLKNIYVKGKK